ncbi:chemotaxis protein CheW [Massilia endophytica]|uniref:chemotaxis protein CheW n=1 Tax=Massilia endophytica TaxID=2899220 RepID=UPI001E53EA0D|nr:chemotaxis protein CheW [Massilia endophytica]UGQ45168.1 chemotaxis protein CheW [Massilia endophytica]
MKQEQDGSQQYLTFMLSGETFGLGIMAVKEIIEFSGITEVPMMPDCIRGVINLRGAVVPVMDLSARFGKALSVPGKRTCIVIVELEVDGERQVTGVVVDAVNAVLDIADGEIEKAPSFGTRMRGDFIEGMGKVNGKFVILLNVHNVLALEALANMPEMTAADLAAA